MRSVVVQPEAAREAEDAVAWYEDKEPGLGLHFLHDLDVLYARMARNPEIFQSVGASFRRALMRKFPYAIFYEFSQKMVVVHSIFHCSRKPRDWKMRLEKTQKPRGS